MTSSEYEQWLAKRSPQAPVPSDAVERESDLQDAIIDDCIRRGWQAFYSRMDRSTRRPAGEMDFVIQADGGRTIYVECKAKAGKMSEAQLGVAAHAAKLGHTVHVVRSLQQWTQIAEGK